MFVFTAVLFGWFIACCDLLLGFCCRLVFFCSLVLWLLTLVVSSFIVLPVGLLFACWFVCLFTLTVLAFAFCLVVCYVRFFAVVGCWCCFVQFGALCFVVFFGFGLLGLIGCISC